MQPFREVLKNHPPLNEALFWYESNDETLSSRENALTTIFGNYGHTHS